MIVSKPEQVRKHLPSYNFKVGPDRLNDFLQRAQEWVTEYIIGESIAADLEAPVQEGHTDQHANLRTLTSRVICEHAYLTAAAEMDLQLSEAGFVVQNSNGVAPASQQRVDRLVQSLGGRMNDDCDALVKYLLKESKGGRLYEEWRGTEQYSYLTQAFTPTMSELRQHSNRQLEGGWREFLELLPQLNLSMRTTLADYVSIEQVEAMLEIYRDYYGYLGAVHRNVLRWFIMSAMADIDGQTDNAIHFAIEARGYMLLHQADFADFVNSDRFNLPDVDFGEGPVANLL